MQWGHRRDPQQQSAGLGDTMTSVGGSSVGVGGGHSSQRAPSLSANQKRRSSTTATRFSLRNVNTPGANMLSANLLDGVGGDEADRPESARPLPGRWRTSSFSDQLPTTPAAYPTQGSSAMACRCHLAECPRASVHGRRLPRRRPCRGPPRARARSHSFRASARARRSPSLLSAVSRSIVQDVATLPQKLGELLLANHARAIDLFRAMDPNGEGQISRDAFRKALMALGLISRPRDKSPTRRGSMDDGLSSPSGRSSRRGRSSRPSRRACATTSVNRRALRDV